MQLLNLNKPFGLASTAPFTRLTCLFAAVFFSVFVSVCSSRAEDSLLVASATQANLPAGLTAPHSAAWRDQIGTFKIGLVRGWSSDMSRPALARVERVFSKAIGIPVRVVVFERFTSLMEAQAGGRIDLAAYSARAFATARLMCECVEALAIPSTMAGETGQIAVLAGDAARMASLAATGTPRLGRVAKAPVATKDMVRGALTLAGKPATGKEPIWVDYPGYGEVIKAYHSHAIDGFVFPAAATQGNMSGAGAKELDGQMDLASGASTSPSRPATVLWRSSFWPYGPVAVLSHLPAGLKSILMTTLEQMDVIDPLAHSTLSEGLPGRLRKADFALFSPVTVSMRTLINLNANWR